MSEVLTSCAGCGDIWSVQWLTDDYLCPKCLADIDAQLEREPS